MGKQHSVRKEFIAVIKSLEIKELSNAESKNQDTSTELVEEQTIISEQAPQERQRRDVRVTEKRMFLQKFRKSLVRQKI